MTSLDGFKRGLDQFIDDNSVNGWKTVLCFWIILVAWRNNRRGVFGEVGFPEAPEVGPLWESSRWTTWTFGLIQKYLFYVLFSVTFYVDESWPLQMQICGSLFLPNSFELQRQYSLVCCWITFLTSSKDPLVILCEFMAQGPGEKADMKYTISSNAKAFLGSFFLILHPWKAEKW